VTDGSSALEGRIKRFAVTFADGMPSTRIVSLTKKPETPVGSGL
jgi:hypothetical protein